MLKNLIAYLTDNEASLFDTSESAELIGKSKQWFERHRWAGTGPEFIKIGRTPYYSGRELLCLINSSSDSTK